MGPVSQYQLVFWRACGCSRSSVLQRGACPGCGTLRSERFHDIGGCSLTSSQRHPRDRFDGTTLDKDPFVSIMVTNRGREGREDAPGYFLRSWTLGEGCMGPTTAAGESKQARATRSIVLSGRCYVLSRGADVRAFSSSVTDAPAHRNWGRLLTTRHASLFL